MIEDYIARKGKALVSLAVTVNSFPEKIEFITATVKEFCSITGEEILPRKLDFDIPVLIKDRDALQKKLDDLNELIKDCEAIIKPINKPV